MKSPLPVTVFAMFDTFESSLLCVLGCECPAVQMLYWLWEMGRVSEAGDGREGIVGPKTLTGDRYVIVPEEGECLLEKTLSNISPGTASTKRRARSNLQASHLSVLLWVFACASTVAARTTSRCDELGSKTRCHASGSRILSNELYIA